MVLGAFQKTLCLKSYLEQDMSALLGLVIQVCAPSMLAWVAATRKLVSLCFVLVVSMTGTAFQPVRRCGLIFTHNERCCGMGQRRNLCMNMTCAVHSGKIQLVSVWYQVRKQGSQHLKAYKIYLLSEFLFLFHLIKSNILFHLFCHISYWNLGRMLHHLCFSPTASALTSAQQHQGWWVPASWLL